MRLFAFIALGIAVSLWLLGRLLRRVRTPLSLAAYSVVRVVAGVFLAVITVKAALDGWPVLLLAPATGVLALFSFAWTGLIAWLVIKDPSSLKDETQD